MKRFSLVSAGATALAMFSLNAFAATFVYVPLGTGTAPYHPLVSPNHRYAYVSNRGDGTVSEIDLSTWKVVRQIPAGPAPSHMVLSIGGKRLFVVSSSNGELSTIDLAGSQPLRSMPLAAGLHGLDLSDDGRWLFVSSHKEGRLFSVSTEDETVRTLDLAPKPYSHTT